MSQQNLASEGQTPMKAEQSWALQQVSKGNTLPRGRVFDAYRNAAADKVTAAAPVAKAKLAAVKKAAPKVAEKPAPKAESAAPAGLTDAQAKAFAELQANGGWASAKDLGARKATLDALVKKEAAETQEQDGEAVYKAK
ncbi:hypothetical protein K0504_17570 [Neiella marina]|uniref:Uncharacterized protein n=1 Tax=Neiella holothuriorum TaxID=2870530 RepID=A0ABS7EKL5_9GAMM|nr:hypothetical protein [Neiella holothuriorum]MBW8192850.1 hypothetical protein [Neiella holothuriorum]